MHTGVGPTAPQRENPAEQAAPPQAGPRRLSTAARLLPLHAAR